MSERKYVLGITGVTGLLGRNLLFEYLKKYKNNLYDIKIVLLGRSSNEFSLKERVKNIVLEDGKSSLCFEDKKLLKLTRYLKEEIAYINLNLEKSDLGLYLEDKTYLSSLAFNIVYCASAYLTFGDSKNERKKLNNINIVGTENLLKFLGDLQIEKFCYFSSAFATGILSEIVAPDDLKLERDFRNPYEYSKLYSEILIRNFEKKHNIPSYIFRTSILAGRLMDQSIGEIHKYDVFYGWTQFFIKIKKSFLEVDDDPYTTPLKIDMRLVGNERSTLNIIPVDFAAKASIKIMSQQNISHSAFHLVNRYETEFIIPILNFLNLKGFTFVNEVPEDLNRVEKLYYKYVGKLFTNYMQNEGHMYYDYTSLKENLEEKILCPKIDEKKLLVLLEYAKNNNFGIN